MLDDTTTLEAFEQAPQSDSTLDALTSELNKILELPISEENRDKVDELYTQYARIPKPETGADELPDTQTAPQKDSFILAYEQFYEKYNLHSSLDATEINLERKKSIVNQILELEKGLKDLKTTRTEYRKLKEEFDSLGKVPHDEEENINQQFKSAVLKYQHYIKLNNELKEVSYKKNQPIKEQLVVEAQSLLSLPPVKAFSQLQDLHAKWKATGPVPEQVTEQLWNEFSIISKKINKQHKEFYLRIKEEQKQNLQLKLEICEKLESILQEEINDFKHWSIRTNEVISLQKEWKKIGPVKRAKDKSVYQRYRKASDTFFDRKQAFFEAKSVDYSAHIEKKKELITQAKELSTSTDWEHTSASFNKLSQQWKKIGYVPFKQSRELWNEFKTHCDTFYQRKRNKNNISQEEQDANAAQKQALITALKDYDVTGKSVDEQLEYLAVQGKKWSQIGFVPMQIKSQLQNAYNTEVDKLFQKLEVSEEERMLLRYKVKVKNIMANPNSEQKLLNEEYAVKNSISKLEATIQTYQANISFIQGNSQEGDKLKQDINKKVETNLAQLALLKKKVQLVNKARHNKL